ncbi:hypothetical protein HYH03_014587 [Edaphochlamys debaryana]|uniref:Uncharacterized protein n=1 Tax=Edaphochlamys debaryana TaxID=47281 RepID=A0A835XPV8_9CHLO|nr:hypothetical protein HYH03_014587 [Edaphochlamys debaryana]|eukprot:KAG2486788.1 hypothetical protein HYH03_014587 [Edaphochlamys debaryana]
MTYGLCAPLWCNGKKVECLLDPCQYAYCPNYRDTATCYPSYCGVDRSFQGVLFVDTDGKAISQQECFSIEITKIGECRLAAPYYSCPGPDEESGFVPPTCENTECAGYPNAICTFTGCAANYHGVDLPGCKPLFFDPATGEYLNDKCLKPAHRRDTMHRRLWAAT